MAAAVGWALLILFAQPQTVSAQQWTGPDGNNNISNVNTGNVGVGLTTPLYKFDVLSGTDIMARFGSSAAAHSQLLINAPSGYNSNLTLQNGGVSKWFLGNRAANNRFSFLESTGTIEVFSILQNGNVGIGTTVPDTKLHIFSSSTNTNLAGLQFADIPLALRNTSSTNNNLNLISLQDAAGYGNVLLGGVQTNQTSHSGEFVVMTRNAGTIGERLRVSSAGNVGIGTAAPLYKLDVTGDINATGFRINGVPISTGPVSSVFGRTGVVVAATNDYTWTQINKSTSSLGDLQTRSAGDLNAGTVPLARLGLSGTANSTTFLRGDNTWGTVPNSQWTTSGSNNIYYNTGNVGIGTLTPTTKLHVVGDVTVTGNIAAKYQDVAEWVPASSALPAGTVVTLDPTKSNHVEASSKAYDTRVAGVISAQPGIALGESGANKVLVATTGRVLVKVDASRGPIRVGDLLVTSGTHGLAMKSEPIKVGGRLMHMPGTLIGKALEPLEKGSGKILVLLSLQ